MTATDGTDARAETIRNLRAAETSLMTVHDPVTRVELHTAVAEVWARLAHTDALGQGTTPPGRSEDATRAHGATHGPREDDRYEDNRGNVWTVVRVDEEGPWLVRDPDRVARYRAGGFDHLAIRWDQVVLSYYLSPVDVGTQDG